MYISLSWLGFIFLQDNKKKQNNDASNEAKYTWDCNTIVYDHNSIIIVFKLRIKNNIRLLTKRIMENIIICRISNVEHMKSIYLYLILTKYTMTYFFSVFDNIIQGISCITETRLPLSSYFLDMLLSMIVLHDFTFSSSFSRVVFFSKLSCVQNREVLSLIANVRLWGYM